MNLTIGTRKSKLALVQTDAVIRRIQEAAPEVMVSRVCYTTRGDQILSRPLSEIGGKGVFVGEIEAALCSGAIDLAVHSAKDLPLNLREGTEIAAVLPRGNPQDMLVIRREAAAEMQENRHAVYRIGTGSGRRISGVRRLYPNAEFAGIRGNIDTRLEKLHRGEYDAIVLAAAGLARLSLTEHEQHICLPLPVQDVVPAPCQGIIAVQSRSGALPELMRQICDENTRFCYETERAVLRLTDAGCSAPIGAYSEIAGGRITLYVTWGHQRILCGSAPVSGRIRLAEGLVKQL